MGKQLELFPDMNWKEYKYKGKIYRRYNAGTISYRKRIELDYKLKRFIDEYNKKTI